jgi:hypothetical protein
MLKSKLVSLGVVRKTKPSFNTEAFVVADHGDFSGNIRYLQLQINLSEDEIYSFSNLYIIAAPFFLQHESKTTAAIVCPLDCGISRLCGSG